MQPFNKNVYSLPTFLLLGLSPLLFFLGWCRWPSGFAFLSPWEGGPARGHPVGYGTVLVGRTALTTHCHPELCFTASLSPCLLGSSVCLSRSRLPENTRGMSECMYCPSPLLTSLPPLFRQEWMCQSHMKSTHVEQVRLRTSKKKKKKKT